MTEHYLPSKVRNYLQRLELEYTAADDGLVRSVVRSARSYVIPEAAYDNWNGGTYGHDVILYLPREVMSRIRLAEQKEICEHLKTDLNTCASGVSNEFFNAVVLELEDENDPNFRQATPFSTVRTVNPDVLSIWKSGYVRLFVSHRDRYKRQAQSLSKVLEGFGISCFVAHDTIEPMEVWRHEIEKGLASMEIMLALITEDFHESVWTNQEVGYALGKGVPIINVKWATNDPLGFIEERQALRADPESPEDAAGDIYRIIGEKLGHKTRLQYALISAFAKTPDWGQATIRFGRLEKLVTRLTDKELQRILDAFEENDQLHAAAHLNNYSRLIKFLERATGKSFEQVANKIFVKGASEDEIPF